jgi:hypothetical protein
VCCWWAHASVCESTEELIHVLGRNISMMIGPCHCKVGAAATDLAMNTWGRINIVLDCNAYSEAARELTENKSAIWMVGGAALKHSAFARRLANQLDPAGRLCRRRSRSGAQVMDPLNLAAKHSVCVFT